MLFVNPEQAKNTCGHYNEIYEHNAGEVMGSGLSGT
jgi:hypothetical protein